MRNGSLRDRALVPVLLGMLSLLVWGGSCLLTGSAGEATAADTPSSAGIPRIQLPEVHYGFGEQAEGGAISHDFVVKNTGTADLHIRKVTPD